MNIECPHCGKGIDLVGPTELREEYGWTAAMIQHNRTIPGFPEPILKFQNRHIYLRKDIERFREERGQVNAIRALEQMEKSLDYLPPELQEGVEKLRKRLNVNNGGVARKVPTNGRKRKR